MSVQSQIDRINGGKTDIVNEIENQGVAVPDGTPIDGLAPYVRSINNSNHTHTASQVSGLHAVATSGNYNDLTNKPTIPAAVTVDSALSSTSTNPVQNKVINSALASKVTLDTPQEITGKKTLTSNFLVKVATNDTLAPSGDWGWASPISKYLWHDLLAFREAKAEYSTNGSTWTEDTSDSFKCNLTNQKENQSINVITDSRPHARFTWDGGSAIWHACQAAWLIIGFTYVASAATCTIKFQSSTDGSTFTDVFTKSMAGNQAPYWLKLNESLWSQCRAVRLTISRTSTAGSLALSSVRWLTKRWGNQGFGSELETPFEWNNDASITRRKSKSTLGTSSAPWAAVYGTTLYEGGTALSSTYAKKTEIGNKADQADVDQLYDMVAEKANTSSLHKVATSGSYNDLTNKPTIPTVNNATLTIQKNGSNVATFTANSASNATANITVPTKTSELTNDSGFKTTDDNTTYSLSKSGSTITLTGSDGSTTSVTDADTNTTYGAAGSALGLVKSGGDVSISDGVITVTDDSHNHVISNVDGLQDALDGKLAKTTYEATAELACGSNGKVCIGKFGAYDTNITIELNSTTSTTYHATIVIHSQNVVANGTGGTVGCYVYGDADNHVTPLLSVFRPYGSASRQIEVYANLAGWSKNLVHIQAVALSTGGMTDVLTSVTEIPASISGKTKVTPVNVLTTNFASKTDLNSYVTTAKFEEVLGASLTEIDTLLGG